MNKKINAVGIENIDYLSLVTNGELNMHSTDFDFIAVVNNGLPVERIHALKNKLGWTLQEITEVINFSVKKNDRCKKLCVNLNIDKTESVLDFAMFLNDLSDGLKGKEKFILNDWLFIDNPNTQDREPFKLLNTKMGRRYVLNLYNYLDSY